MSLGACDEYETEHDSKPVCHGDTYFATAPWRASPILSSAPLCSKNNIRVNSWPDHIQCSFDLRPRELAANPEFCSHYYTQHTQSTHQSRMTTPVSYKTNQPKKLRQLMKESTYPISRADIVLTSSPRAQRTA
ncbi:hypothetical protein TRAPUB_3541 [Trametes pubescens]|uniref:Uncharacterized protein n=1 Tax=Trametes pubescens TaxID=154538 RepID=A0A1M2VDK2_TRAPU|nr:hypothetical protein TRAPUB_3541 [Trametes pubescens]